MRSRQNKVKQSTYNKSPSNPNKRIINTKNSQTNKSIEKLTQSNKRDQPSRSFIAYTTRDESKLNRSREERLRTPEPYRKEEVQRFVPLKLNNGIDMENYTSSFTKNSANIEKIVNSLNRFKLYSANTSNVKEKGLVNEVSSEQSREIKQLQSRLAYFREQAQKLQSENAGLKEENVRLQKLVNIEPNKLFTANERIVSLEIEIAMIRKERNNLMSLYNNTNIILENTITILKYI